MNVVGRLRRRYMSYLLLLVNYKHIYMHKLFPILFLCISSAYTHTHTHKTYSSHVIVVTDDSSTIILGYNFIITLLGGIHLFNSLDYNMIAPIKNQHAVNVSVTLAFSLWLAQFLSFCQLRLIALSLHEPESLCGLIWTLDHGLMHRDWVSAQRWVPHVYKTCPITM